MDYSTLVATLANLLTVEQDNEDFVQILPVMINDAEERIYREADFLYTRETVATDSFTAGSRSFTLPNSILVAQKVNCITPALTAPDNGTRVPLQWVSLDFLDSAWPNASGGGSQGVPSYAALKNASTIVVAPTPDADYIAEVVGTYRPETISETNTTTYISTTYPDLLVAACMIFGSAWQRDFGAMTDDPRTAISWESQYQTHFRSAYEEEQRRKGASTGWSPYQQTPLATPPRT